MASFCVALVAIVDCGGFVHWGPGPLGWYAGGPWHRGCCMDCWWMGVVATAPTQVMDVLPCSHDSPFPYNGHSEAFFCVVDCRHARFELW